MKRILILLVATMPFLMCFQCGCDEPNTVVTLHVENATDEDLYLSSSAQPWPNVDCHWRHLPYKSNCNYWGDGSQLSPGEQFRRDIGENGDSYVLIVDAGMTLRACWAIDSLPMADSTRWASVTTTLGSTNCNGIHPTHYTHTFTIDSDDLME